MSVSVRALVVGSAVGLLGAGVASGTDLYDIDFSEPYHTFGQPVTLDTGAVPREGFSGYSITDPADEPLVDGGFDLRAMTDGVAAFGARAQALLAVNSFTDGIPGADFDIYTLELNAMVFNGGALTIFFDSPTINRFYIGADFPATSSGVITYGTGPVGTPELAPFTFGELLAVRVTFDADASRWRIEVDGEVLYEGATQNAVAELREVRLIGEGGVFLDNIRLTGSYKTCTSADLNEDGILDLSDIAAFVDSFNAGCGG